MAIDREMPLKEQLKFDMNAADVEVMDGDPQLDADGGATINFGSDVQMAEGHTENLAEFLSDGDLDSIATDLLEAYEGDKDDIHTLLEMHVDLDLPGYEDANEDGRS